MLHAARRLSAFVPIAACLVAGLLGPLPALAQPDIAGTSAEGDPGTEVAIDFSWTQGGDAAAIQLDLTWDPSVLDLGTLSAGDALVDHSLDWSEVDTGRARVTVVTATPSPLGDGRLFTVPFTIATDAPAGSWPVAVESLLISSTVGDSVGPREVTGGEVIVLAGSVPPPEIPTLGTWSLALLTLLLLVVGLHAVRGGAPLLVLVAVSLAALSLATPARAAVPAGDANGDGNVDSADIPVIVDQILERGTASGDPDCNGDSSVDVRDTICAATAAPPLENEPPVLDAIADLGVREREIVGFVATAADPDLPDDELAWSLLEKPVGATIDPASGSILWVPTGDQVGASSFRVRVTDQAGASDEETFVVDVRALGGPPVLEDIVDREVVESDALSLTATASDPDLPDDALAFDLMLAPAGMGIDAASGEIAWTPGTVDVGLHDVTVRVTDQEGLIDFTSFVVDVREVNVAPVAKDDIFEARLGVPLSVEGPGVLGNDSDANGDVLTSVLDSGPAEGDLVLQSDGSFEYLLEPPDRRVPVELEQMCEGDFKHNGSLGVGDVDGDGDLEIVGAEHLVGSTGNSELWMVDADTCEAKRDADGDLVLDPGLVNSLGGVDGRSKIALLDVDGDGDLEIIAAHDDKEHLVAFHHDGSLAWRSETSHYLSTTNGGSGDLHHAGLHLADLDADGTVEIVAAIDQGFNHNVYSGALVYNAEDGSIQWEYMSDFRQGGSNHQKMATVVDLDLDGTLEVIVHNSVLDHDGMPDPDGVLDRVGELEFRLPTRASVGTSTAGHLVLAVANFDDDAYPELLGRDWENRYLFEHDGTVKWQIAEPSSTESQLVVADLDGDDEPEFAEFGCDGGRCFLQMFDMASGSPSLVWSHENEPDLSFTSRWDRDTAAIAFDANRDGAHDLLYRRQTFRDQVKILVIDGTDGSLLTSLDTPNRKSGTHDVVTIADVDQDGDAEIVATWVLGFSRETLAVWTGTEDHPLPYAPPYRNQWHVSEAWVKPDLTIPTNPVPHWLQPGLNGWFAVKQEPDPLIGTNQTFTYHANDGALDSNQATVTLDVLPAGNPPRFLSDPDALTTRGFRYAYAPIVVDPDLGDVVSFHLTEGPDGMTIDPATGEVEWLPDTNGTYPVTILATDTIGFAVDQSWDLVVGDPVTVPEVVGLPRATAESQVTGASLLVGRTSEATHPSIPAGSVSGQAPIGGSVAEFGAEVDLVVSLGPAPEDVDDDGDGFTETGGDCDDDDAAIHPGAPDPPADGIDQDCDGFDGSEPVAEVVVEPATLDLLAGESRQLKAWAVFADGTAQVATDLATWQSLNGTTATVTANGRLTAVADTGPAQITATLDAKVGTADVNVTDADGTDEDAPTVEITSPVDGESVFGPVEVLGTADDPNLVRYELLISPAGEESFTKIGGGTSPVLGGVLGELDPTLMLNGLYTLRLTVLDAGGNETLDQVLIGIDGQQKVGAFTLSFTDLQVPVAGIPLTLTRVYDSRDKSRGDFGVGWRLGFDTLGLSCSSPLGKGWFVAKSGLSYQLLETRPHRCSVRIPGGRSAEFDFVPSATVSPIVPFSFLSGSFVPRPGTTGRLESMNEVFLAITEPQPGEVTLRNDVDLSLFSPRELRYTTSDGTVVEFGPDGVRRIADQSGNEVEFSDTEIRHSSGRTLGIARDPLGRITQLTDPMGNVQTYDYSASGDLVAHTDALGNVTRFYYDLEHGLVRVEDALGNAGIRSEYDADGRLVAITDAAGHRTTFDHDLDARQTVETDSEGHARILEFDEQGNVLRREQTVTIEGVPTPVVETFEYDTDGLQTASVNADGTRTEFSWDADQNQTAQVLDPGGEALTTSFTYDGQSNLTGIVGPGGESTTIEYGSSGNFTALVDATGARSDIAYDSRGLVTRFENATGAVQEVEHNAAGNITSIRVFGPAGGLVQEETRTYDALGRRLTTTTRVVAGGEEQVATSSLTWDAAGNLVSETDATGATTTYEVDALGRRTAVVDPLGNRTENVYDAVGNQTEVRRPDGTSLRFTYDALGRLVEETDPLGATTRHAYDELGRRIETTYPDGAVERWVYSPAGRLVARIDPLGERTEFDVDALGRRTRVTDPTGAVSVLEYDASGRLVAEIDPLGQRTERTLDARGRVIGLTFADGTEVSFDLDSFGRPVRTTDELGRVTEIDYDGAGRPIRVVDPLGGVTTYAYDPSGRLLSRTDANGRTTRLEYDAVGRAERVILPTGSKVTQTWDAAGRLAAVTNARGQTVTHGYDALGRRTTKTLPDGGVVTTTYDAAGRPLTVIGPSGTVTQTWDSRGRLVSSTQPAGRVESTYDLAGRLASVSTTVDGVERRVDYGRDVAGRLSSLTEAGVGTTTFELDAGGRRLRSELPNGLETVFAYDQRNRLVSVEHRDGATVLASFTADRDAVGDLLEVTDLGGATASFLYDDLRRLVRETHRDQIGTILVDLEHTWDAVGNRTGLIDHVTAQTETATYDEGDRLLSAGDASFTWDASGNLTGRSDPSGTTDFSWDAENRLAGIDGPSGPLAFTYDPLGRRIGRDGPGSSERFLVDERNPTGLAQVLDVVDSATGTRVAGNTFADGPMSTVEGGDVLFHHRGLTRSVRLGTDSAGDVSHRTRYSAFGETLEGAPQRYGYQGEELDPSSGLYYMRARYYQPDTARFLSREPFPGRATDPRTFHPYQYAFDNPLSFSDPTGLFAIGELSIVQTIQNGLKNLKLGSGIKALCSAKTTADVAELLILAGSLGLDLAVPGDDVDAAVPLFTTDKPRNRWEKRLATKIAPDEFKIVLAPFKPELAAEAKIQGNTYEAKINKDGLNLGRKSDLLEGTALNVPLVQFWVCGKWPVAELKLAGEASGGLTFFDSSSPIGIQVGAEVAFSLKVESASLKLEQKFPFAKASLSSKECLKLELIGLPIDRFSCKSDP